MVAKSQTTSQESEDSLATSKTAEKFKETLQKTNSQRLDDTSSQRTRVRLNGISKAPFISLQQYLKGNASGLFVKEESGEPGSEQFMFIRGLSSPLFNKQDVYGVQPVVYLNGTPLTQENAFSYNIQRYDFNKLGSGTNLLAALDINNIGSIEVLKTPADIATLGPLATNGAIWITTKVAQPSAKPIINFESYVGMLRAPKVKTINAAYENDFRKRYYDAYATPEQLAAYPVYVANQYDKNYYGPSNWNDIYYQSKPVYYVGFGLNGGHDRASYRFNISDTKDHNFDDTNFDRYALTFGMNMLPLKWLTISSNINAARTDRDRNKSLRDRFAETRFVPDLANPLSPNKEAYQLYLDKYRTSIDDNKNNAISGDFTATADIQNLQIKTQLSIDYEEALRDVFWGSELMDGNSFISTYYGLAQRTSIKNTIRYTVPLAHDQHRIRLEAGQNYVSDFFKYDYIYGYNTPNDFIKIKSVLVNGSAYSNNDNIFAYPFSDNLKARLSSYYGRIGYSFKNVFSIDAVGRYDGYSSFSPTDRWLLTPVVATKVNIHELMPHDQLFSTFALRGSWGTFGKLIQDSRFKLGPQYRVDLGYSDEPVIGGSGGYSGISQTYSFGWINRYYNWPFSEKLNIGLDLGWLNDRVILTADFYNNKDKNMIVPTSVASENGFSYKWVQGMAVQNTGLNLGITADILHNPGGVSWQFFTNFNWNKNKLLKLPYDLNEIVYGDMKLVVGKPADSYWLFENQGMIEDEASIPPGRTNVDGTVLPMTFGGTIPFSVGDPLWADINKDGVIDQNDKVLKGHFLPVYTGGIGSTLSFRRFNLDFMFYYALGQQLLNRLTSTKLDFINSENSRDIASIKEVTFWQQTFDYNTYPLYNPWSGVIPYRADQDLFLEDADFLKLRYVTLGYDLASLDYFKKKKIPKMLVYVTGTNLFTLTKFSGGDPEQVNYRGAYTGYALPLAASYSLGVKINF
ncbi:SusC/RagA family TonB-linked outer membrane protein [Niabella aurantiaca]|uniref:SusC/RagA family TonB-linked outer membrane protein n=1 Tax=Niabella aurantiaca TaxID=379900 RepID=UPI00036E9037|nr:SusC/RagA family TonB-linked outer membrane protein [Niabella aurantiaca]